MSTRQLEIKLPLPDGKALEDCHDNELNAAMNVEVDEFSAVMKQVNREQLFPMERSLIKTYIAWKLGRLRAK